MMVVASSRSRTSVAIGPVTDSVGQPRKPGIFGISPNVGLRPVVPQNADGMRMDPPRRSRSRVALCRSPPMPPHLRWNRPQCGWDRAGCASRPQFVAGDAAITELRIVGLPHDDRAGLDQPGDARTVLGGDK